MCLGFQPETLGQTKLKLHIHVMSIYQYGSEPENLLVLQLVVFGLGQSAKRIQSHLGWNPLRYLHVLDTALTHVSSACP